MRYTINLVLVLTSLFIAPLSIPTPLSYSASPSIRQNQTTIQGTAKLKLKFKFKKDTQGWTGGFADLPVDANREGLVFKFDQLPSYLDEGRKALFIAGVNGSDDLFMFIKRQLTGLKPNTRYEVSFTIQIATDAPSGCVGVGGSPGESVYLKAGGATQEPLVIERDGWYRMNIEKGNQAFGGSNAVVLGHIGNKSSNCVNPQYEYKDFESADAHLEIASDKDGNMWLIIGTDSGFEARTAIYYTRIIATLREN